jgi:hypothetical protein
LDDRKRKLVVAMLRPGATEPEEREIPNVPGLSLPLTGATTPARIADRLGEGG